MTAFRLMPDFPDSLRGQEKPKTEAVKTTPRKWTDGEIQWCLQRKEEGFSNAEIAQAVGRSEISVQIKLKRMTKSADTYNVKHRALKYETNCKFADAVQPESVLDLFAGHSWWAANVNGCVTNDKDEQFNTDYHRDAFRLISELYWDRRKFDVVDLDPYGSAYDCLDYAARVAQKGLVVSFGEWGHKRWKRLDYVRHRYRIENLDGFVPEAFISEVQRICQIHKKKAVLYSLLQYGTFLRAYFLLESFKETSQWESSSKQTLSLF